MDEQTAFAAPTVARPEHDHILQPESAPASRTSSSTRSIPSLDGLRAVAVLMVILSHASAWSNLPKNGALHAAVVVVGQGGLGVSIFFVISGFLITTLLLQEEDRTGTIHLRRFYFRRTFRIFPPFYAYLAIAAVVAWLCHRALSWHLLLMSAGYVTNFVPYAWVGDRPSFWYLAHTWSLAVEEQFYLLWPFLLVLVPRRRAVQLSVAVLLTAPLLRLAAYELLPIYRVAEQWYHLLPSALDLLVFGGLFALINRIPAARSRMIGMLHPALLLPAAGFLLVSGLLMAHMPPWFGSLAVISTTGVCVVLLLACVVRRPATLPGRFLNWAPLRHIGLVSYSLYLWQQMFTGPYWTPTGWLNVAAIFAAAELSFWCVERPSLRLRGVLEERLGLGAPGK